MCFVKIVSILNKRRGAQTYLIPVHLDLLNFILYFFIEVRCPSLPQPENGRHHGSDSRFVMGQEVIFQCDSGYSLVGDQILKCEFNEELQTGVWSARLPVCSRTYIPILQKISPSQIHVNPPKHFTLVNKFKLCSFPFHYK